MGVISCGVWELELDRHSVSETAHEITPKNLPFSKNTECRTTSISNCGRVRLGVIWDRLFGAQRTIFHVHGGCHTTTPPLFTLVLVTPHDFCPPPKTIGIIFEQERIYIPSMKPIHVSNLKYHINKVFRF